MKKKRDLLTLSWALDHLGPYWWSTLLQQPSPCPPVGPIWTCYCFIDSLAYLYLVLPFLHFSWTQL